MTKISSIMPERDILKELGGRLARIRKQQGFAQTVLAEEAGLGVATLRRIESGQDSQLESWLKILKALNMTSAIEAFLPEQLHSPMAQARGKSRSPTKTSATTGLVWGDELK